MPPDRRPTLLATTIGGEVGEALLDALAADRGRLRIVGANARAAAAANFLCDATHLVPPTAEAEAWAAAMRRVLLAERPDLVIPTRDGDVEPLARLKADPALAGIRIWAPGPVTATIAVDKGATAEFARAHGLPFVDTAADQAGLDALIAAHGFPMLAKPRRGTGSKGITIVTVREQADACLAAGGLVLQPFLDAPADLARLLPDPRLGVPLIFALPHRAHVTIAMAVHAGGEAVCLGGVRHGHRGGEGEYSLRDDSPDLAECGLAFAQALAALDFEGVLNLQCLRDGDGRLRVFEINGRLGAGIANRALHGIGERAAILDALFGTRTAVWPASAPPPGLLERARLFRRIPPDAVAALERDGLWRPGPLC